MNTFCLRNKIVAMLVASAMCASCADDNEASFDASASPASQDIFIGEDFDSALLAIDRAVDMNDIEFMDRSWRLAVDKRGIHELSKDPNKLQLAVLLAENLYLMSPESRAETSAFLLKLAHSGNPRHREMSALSLDSVKGEGAVSTLVELARDSDQRVSKFALQSLKSKSSATSFSSATDQDVEDAEHLSRLLPELCDDERLIPENRLECRTML